MPLCQTLITQWNQNPRPLDYLACVVPLCCNVCPINLNSEKSQGLMLSTPNFCVGIIYLESFVNSRFTVDGLTPLVELIAAD